MIMKSVAKSSYKYTGIFGSNAAREIVPAHFHVPTSSTTAEQEKVRFNFCLHIKKTCGQFGHDEVQEWPCGIGMNKKGGMNNKEFDCYIKNTIMPLFLDVEDKSSKGVLLRFDSGPGPNCMKMLCKARYCGVMIFSGLPNASSVQQETDRNYDLFKSMTQRNLDAIAMRCFERKEPIGLSLSTIGLIVYGKVCSQTGVVCKDVVAKAFSTKRNLGSWAAVRAVPFRMQCLSDPQVRHDGNNKSDPEFNKYQIIQSKNCFSCTQLSAVGYNTDLLKTESNEEEIRASAEERTISVTVANTREHQEALQKVSTHGKKIHVTGSENITSDNMFIAA